MKKNLILAAIAIVLCCCGNKTKRKTQDINQQVETVSDSVLDVSYIEKKVLKEAISVEYKDKEMPNTMYVTIGNERIRITPRGKLFKKNSLFLNLSLEDDFFSIERLYFIFDEEYIIAIYTETDMDYAGSRAKKISLKDKKIIWAVDIGGFNMSTPVYDDKYLYVGTIGGIYKLDYIEGKFDWKFENLYDKGKYNVFEKPEFITDNLILFTDEKKDTIIVNDKDKKIILNTAERLKFDFSIQLEKFGIEIL